MNPWVLRGCGEITSLDPKGEWINPDNGDKYAIKDFICEVR